MAIFKVIILILQLKLTLSFIVQSKGNLCTAKLGTDAFK